MPIQIKPRLNPVNILEFLPVKELKIPDYNGKEHKVLVDGDYDGEYIGLLKWRVMTDNNNMVRRTYYEKINGKFINKHEYLHNLVLPKKAGHWVVHLNGNPFDNRSCNLAYMTPKEAIRLRDINNGGTLFKRAIENNPDFFRKRKQGGKTSTKYIGVLRYGNRYEARTRVGGKYKHIGSFSTPEEAARAYDGYISEAWKHGSPPFNFPEEHKRLVKYIKKKEVK